MSSQINTAPATVGTTQRALTLGRDQISGLTLPQRDTRYPRLFHTNKLTLRLCQRSWYNVVVEALRNFFAFAEVMFLLEILLPWCKKEL